MSDLGIIVLIILYLALMPVLVYIWLAKKRNVVRGLQSATYVYLQQRFGLIPNLMNVVKGHVEHEKEVLAEITSLRVQAMTDMKAANQLNAKMMELFAVAEAHPDLKTSEQFLSLQQELSKMENQLQAAGVALNKSSALKVSKLIRCIG